MNGAADEEAVLGRFRQWLAESRAEARLAGNGSGDTAEVEQVGLYRLVEEFTALRHEVKLQTKSGRNIEAQAAAAIAALETAAAEFRGVRAKEAEAARRAATPLAESLVELDEALRRGRAQMDAARRRIVEESPESLAQQLAALVQTQPWWKRKLYRRLLQAVADAVEREDANRQNVFDALSDGYDLILGRLERAFAREGIERIECVGRPADPRQMTVVEALVDADRPNGEVIEEIRPGYLWNGSVLRYAEVRVARNGAE